MRSTSSATITPPRTRPSGRSCVRSPRCRGSRSAPADDGEDAHVPGLALPDRAQRLRQRAPDAPPRPRQLDAAIDAALAVADPEDVEARGRRSRTRRPRRAVRRLPEDRRRALILRLVDEMSTAEIAGVLGRSEGAVRVLLHRALRARGERSDTRRGAVTAREPGDESASRVDAARPQALLLDAYLDQLLAAHDRRAADVPTDAGLDPALRATAQRLRHDLVRFHPSFRFEDRLAARLAALGASRLPAAAGGEASEPPHALRAMGGGLPLARPRRAPGHRRGSGRPVGPPRCRGAAHGPARRGDGLGGSVPCRSRVLRLARDPSGSAADGPRGSCGAHGRTRPPPERTAATRSPRVRHVATRDRQQPHHRPVLMPIKLPLPAAPRRVPARPLDAVPRLRGDALQQAARQGAARVPDVRPPLPAARAARGSSCCSIRGSFEERDAGLESVDPLGLRRPEGLSRRVAAAQSRPGCATRRSGASAASRARASRSVVMDFAFMGGSMGAVVGEKVTRAAEAALDRAHAADRRVAPRVAPGCRKARSR